METDTSSYSTNFSGEQTPGMPTKPEIVLALLNKHTKSKFLLSTHIIELAETFYNEKTCQFNYMESEIKDDRFICSYKLKEGISESRIGSWLVKKELTID